MAGTSDEELLSQLAMPEMNNRQFAKKILGLADDSLILGHRNSEWAGHAPILEEDIAFANLALDELGHAQLWYGLYQELTGTDPDRVVFFREATDWRNTRLVELPRGDWAFSMMRQFLFDVFENVMLAQLVNSTEARVAAIAGKIRSEEIYHLRHTSNWVKRLGLGTDESHERMQKALDNLWGYALELFVPQDGESELAAQGFVPDPQELERAWRGMAGEHLQNSGLHVPESLSSPQNARKEHTEYLAELLADMQSVARSEQFGVEW